MDWDPPILSRAEIGEKADQFLADYHPEGSIPVPIEEIVEFDFDLKLVPIPGVKETIGVDAFLTTPMRAVFVDEYTMMHVPQRYRFTLAHEAGHLILHGGLFERVAFKDLGSWKAFIREADGDKYRWLEWQANQFAGYVLVPEDRLRTRFEHLAAKARKKGVSTTTLVQFPSRQILISTLAAEFEVSEHAMEIRLTTDGILPEL